MLTRIDVAIDCLDVDAQAGFWAAALGYRPHGRSGQYRSLLPPDGSGLAKLILQAVDDAPKQAKNRLHLDLVVGDIEAEAVRLEALGARRASGRIEEAGTAWIVMTDPEGNEFCLCMC